MTKSEIMKIYNFLKNESKTNTHVEAGRLDRALGILMCGEAESGKYYTTLTGCTCMDGLSRHQFICKHRLAFMMEKHPEEIVKLAFEGDLS
jgi:hypothetical protein